MPAHSSSVFNDLFGNPADPHWRRRPCSAAPVDDGVYAVDYGDEDHAFRVTVEVVPRRRWTPQQPLLVGQVDLVDVELVAVMVDNFVPCGLAPHPPPSATG